MQNLLHVASPNFPGRQWLPGRTVLDPKSTRRQRVKEFFIHFVRASHCSQSGGYQRVSWRKRDGAWELRDLRRYRELARRYSFESFHNIHWQMEGRDGGSWRWVQSVAGQRELACV